MRGRGNGRIVWVAGVVALLVGCSASDDAGSVAARACERLDTCNALNAGVSVDECTSSTESDLGKLSAAERADVEKVVGDCLEFQTCTAYLHCLNPDEAPAPPPTEDPPPVSDPPPASGVGQFDLFWEITLDGAASTCATVGADLVTLEATGPAGKTIDVYDCSGLRGLTDPLPVGSYSLVVTIKAGNQELGRSDPFTAVLSTGIPVELGTMTWQFTSN